MKKIMTEWRNFLNEEEQQPLTVGQLKAMVEVLSSNEDQNTKKEKLKKLGGVALKVGAALSGISIIEAGVELVDNIRGLFQAATDPEIINQGKLDNEPWVVLLGINPAFSKIIDDKVEKEFLDKYIGVYTSEVMGLSDNSPLPNFTTALAKYINKTKLNPSDSPMVISQK